MLCGNDKKVMLLATHECLSLTCNFIAPTKKYDKALFDCLGLDGVTDSMWSRTRRFTCLSCPNESKKYHSYKGSDVREKIKLNGIKTFQWFSWRFMVSLGSWKKLVKNEYVFDYPM